MTIQGLILNSETKKAASLLAEKTFERYRNAPGHYRNTANSHLVGHLGEFAAFIWFRDNGFEPEASFSDPSKDRDCDIVTNIGRVEVKTWNEIYWENWGRAVTVSQYPSIKRKADFIFWCSVDDIQSETPKVSFRGFNEVGIFEEVSPMLTGTPGRMINNLQLDISQMKPIDEMGKLNATRGDITNGD